MAGGYIHQPCVRECSHYKFTNTQGLLVYSFCTPRSEVQFGVNLPLGGATLQDYLLALLLDRNIDPQPMPLPYKVSSPRKIIIWLILTALYFLLVVMAAGY